MFWTVPKKWDSSDYSHGSGRGFLILCRSVKDRAMGACRRGHRRLCTKHSSLGSFSNFSTHDLTSQCTSRLTTPLLIASPTPAIEFPSSHLLSTVTSCLDPGSVLHGTSIQVSFRCVHACPLKQQRGKCIPQNVFCFNNSSLQDVGTSATQNKCHLWLQSPYREPWIELELSDAC